MNKTAVIFTLLVLASCATAPVQRQFDPAVTLRGVDPDAAWTAVVDLFAERNWTIDNMDRASGFIGTDWMGTRPGDGFLDCGSAGLAVDTDHNGRLNVTVREAPDGVRLTVNSTWRVVRDFAGNHVIVDCVSTGEIERIVHTEVAARTGATE